MGDLLLGLLCFAGAAFCTWLMLSPGRIDRCLDNAYGYLKRQQSLFAPQAATPPASSASSAPSIPEVRGGQPGWLLVLKSDHLLLSVKAAPTLANIERQSRLARVVWERDLLPAVHRYAEFVQLMPASESHHHAHVGGLLAHTLEALNAAMTWRNGCLLPKGAQAEAADAQRDHWTYAIFFGALLHDVGKPITDLRIDWRSTEAGDALRWMPMTASLVDCGAQQYRVGFTPKAQRDYAAHSRLGVMLLQRLAPASALSFLARQPDVLHTLTQYLAGEDREGALADIIGRADQASTRRALSHGSRARFPTAISVPLIELLMEALRDLLRRGGQLPINRDGAVGWVYDGSIWFVAKRIADQVREHVKQHAPDESIPGDSKNDRLFDTWQEYGCITPNPSTQQAIWYVVVHGADGGGYSHRLSMLKFPLAKLWDDASQYPAPMAGRIEVLAGRDANAKESLAPASDQAGSASDGLAQAASKSADETNATASIPPTPAVRAPSFNAPSRSRRDRRASTSSGPSPGATPVDVEAEVEHLEDEDSATIEARRDQAMRPSVLVSPASKEGSRSTDQATPVAIGTQLPDLADASRTREPSALAIQFIEWLQTGLAHRRITYNEAGSPVHFVQGGMALVSPLIFREFARHHPVDGAVAEAPDRLGMSVQREVLKAGWHVPAPEGKNIHQFSVVKRGGVKAGRLSAVVLAAPHRWVVPVPPPNPAIVPSDPTTTEPMPS